MADGLHVGDSWEAYGGSAEGGVYVTKTLSASKLAIKSISSHPEQEENWGTEDWTILKFDIPITSLESDPEDEGGVGGYYFVRGNIPARLLTIQGRYRMKSTYQMYREEDKAYPEGTPPIPIGTSWKNRDRRKIRWIES